MSNHLVAVTGLTVVVLLLAAAVPVSADNSSPFFTRTIIQKAMAANTTLPTNTNITLGKPIFIEHIKPVATDPATVGSEEGKALVGAVAKARELQNGSFTGSGMIKGVNFTDAGTQLAFLRPGGYSDSQGKGVITTIDGSGKASYTYMAIGHGDANGVRDNGTLFFHTNSTGMLASVNNLVVIYKDRIDKTGTGITVGWDWTR